MTRCDIQEAILCDGSVIADARLYKSVIGVRAVVRRGAVIEESVVMGANVGAEEGNPDAPVGIGEGCHLRRAIVDLDASIGDGSRLINEAGVQEASEENYSIRGGIIVVPRKAVIPPGTVI